MEIILFVAGLLLGGLISWGITHRYYQKSTQDQRNALDQLSAELKPKNTLHDFEKLLDKDRWRKEFINDSEIWISEIDNTFQIEVGKRSSDFSERWTTVYPDSSSSSYPVYLKINGNVVKEFRFISLDGGRIFVPMPDIRMEHENPIYFWNLNSLELKVCMIIGEFYIYGDIFGIARRSKIEIVS